MAFGSAGRKHSVKVLVLTSHQDEGIGTSHQDEGIGTTSHQDEGIGTHITSR